MPPAAKVCPFGHSADISSGARPRPCWSVTQCAVGFQRRRVTHTWTYQVTHPGRTIVEVALTSLNSVDDDDGTFGRFGISQIVSDKGVENFGDDGPPVLARAR